jgi:hypothetical protein
MLDCFCKGPVHKLQIIVAILLVITILILAWLTLRQPIEGFQADANIINFNLLKSQWAEAAVKSGLIKPAYFPTYQSVMAIAAPPTGVNRSDFEKAINALAQTIKVWYVNAEYGGDLASLAAAIDASIPKYVSPPTDGNPIIPVKVAANSAEAGTVENVDYELNTFFKPLLPYYEMVIRVLAQNKVPLTGSEESIKAAVERAIPQVEIEMAANNPIAPLLAINDRIKDIQAGDGTAFQKSAAILTVLPDKVNLYLSTLAFTTTKAQEAYKYISSMGQTADGPKMPPVQGSSAASLGIDSALFFADAGGQGPLATVKSKYTQAPDEVANTYYRVSQTRRKLLDEQVSKFSESMKVAKETFARLEALQKQASSANPSVYANVVAGKSLIDAAA